MKIKIVFFAFFAIAFTPANAQDRDRYMEAKQKN